MLIISIFTLETRSYLIKISTPNKYESRWRDPQLHKWVDKTKIVVK